MIKCFHRKISELQTTFSNISNGNIIFHGAALQNLDVCEVDCEARPEEAKY